jgi:hypothetical protein
MAWAVPNFRVWEFALLVVIPQLPQQLVDKTKEPLATTTVAAQKNSSNFHIVYSVQTNQDT